MCLRSRYLLLSAEFVGFYVGDAQEANKSMKPADTLVSKAKVAWPLCLLNWRDDTLCPETLG